MPSFRVVGPGRAGITLAVVADYAATGVDCISSGALTSSAPALDLGLDLYDPESTCS